MAAILNQENKGLSVLAITIVSIGSNTKLKHRERVFRTSSVSLQVNAEHHDGEAWPAGFCHGGGGERACILLAVAPTEEQRREEGFLFNLVLSNKEMCDTI